MVDDKILNSLNLYIKTKLCNMSQKHSLIQFLMHLYPIKDVLVVYKNVGKKEQKETFLKLLSAVNVKINFSQQTMKKGIALVT